jgi:hypothetical protein
MGIVERLLEVGKPRAVPDIAEGTYGRSTNPPRAMSQSPAELWSGLWAADQPEPSARGRPLALRTFNDKAAKRLEA